MPQIYCLKCYLTRPQYEKVRQAAQLQGHRTISNYARHVLTGNNVLIEQKIIENNKMLKELRDRFLKSKS
jgi:hypothetical protein